MPAAAVLVGLISRGDWVVQLVSLVEASAQPIRKVMVVAAATAALVVQVMAGADTAKVQVADPSSL